jgi:hypothetical protein
MVRKRILHFLKRVGRRKEKPKRKNRLEELGRKEEKIEIMEKAELRKLDRIKNLLVSIKQRAIQRQRIVSLARGFAGSFLGIGIGMGLISISGVAKNLPWTNAIGILVFIWGIGIILIYKNEQEMVKSGGIKFIISRLLYLYLISIFVEYISLVLFNLIPPDYEMLAKTLIIGSYPAMAGAISFSLI